ncbi:hypothetical protein [Dyadobacter diqingensis]|uniref:hypothetical protein n=1 Tax=Dyadobacter diqingensis TaxID=2938121 RepID=UPI0020C1AF9D|nr:hypothetical protein [Dyadobacter diqingensis]
MKKAFLFFVLCHSVAYAQQNAFVLVDVSGSAKNLHNVKLEARNLVYALLTGGRSVRDFTGWTSKNPNDSLLTGASNGQPMTGVDSWLCIMPFGHRNRYKDFRIQRITQFPDQIKTFFDSYYPTTYSDKFTYMSIAEAYTAQIANENKISEYYIYMVTDGLGDQDETDSQIHNNITEKNLINQWGNKTSTEVSKVGVFEKQGYQIIVKKIINHQLAHKIPPHSRDSADTHEPKSYEIRLTSYANGKPKNPIKIEKEDISVSWACADCPQRTAYRVNIAGIGNRFRDQRNGLISNSTRYQLTPGKYRITVSGDIPGKQEPVSSATTYIEITSKSTVFILIALATLAAGIAVALYLLRKKKERERNARRSESGQGPGIAKTRPRGGDSGDLNII